MQSQLCNLITQRISGAAESYGCLFLSVFFSSVVSIILNHVFPCLLSLTDHDGQRKQTGKHTGVNVGS